MDGRASGFNWLRLYISRFCRIAPLYFFVILLVFLVIAWISRGKLNVPILELLKQMFLALGLGIFELPNLNDVKDSGIIVAFVLWTLPYEWVFYFSLPALAFFLRIKTPKIYFFFPVLCILFFIFRKPGYHVFLPFISGIISAILVRFEVIRRFMVGTFFSFVMMLCLVVVITKPPLGGVGSQLLLAVVFLIIASGNTLFGVFTSRASRILGEISFSIYLLHGIFLFCAFNFIIGVEKAKEFSTLEFYSVIFAISPMLILTSYITYSRIERPAMLAVTRISSSLVAVLNKHGFAKSSY